MTKLMSLDPDETHPAEAKGLEEIDRLAYHVRRLLKKLDCPVSFQDPPASARSRTMVFRDPTCNPVPEIRSSLESIGFSKDNNCLVRPFDRTTVIVSFPMVDTNDGNTNRPAIRIAYTLLD